MSDLPPPLDWRIQDVAAYFGVVRQTVHRWMAAKENPIPHHRPGGGRARFRSQEVIEWATDSTPKD